MSRSARCILAITLATVGSPLVASAFSAAAAQAATVSASTGSAGGNDSVIVVLRDQYSFPDTTGGAVARMAAARAAQAPVVSSLQRSGATGVTQLPLIDGVVATVTSAEAASLAADPAVAAVVPNAVFRGPAPVTVKPGSATAAAALAPGVCPAKHHVQLNPEGVELVQAVSDDPHALTARSLGFTGAGVTVGDIAVGIDPDELEMIRPDGQHVIAHYVDFTGEGTAVQGPEDLESYLDDSVMAAQGRSVYDLHDYTSPAMPKGCDIRLQGVAPGITIDAYKVYGDEDMTTTSAFLEAINYAVNVDRVNVLNEEGGSFPMPDTSQDLIKMANDAAMAAGVTITSPSYDAGPENTIWSPSSQPGVISVGASTGFRSYAQDDVGEYTQVKARGWVSDNVSSLSSGGATEGGRTIDVLAPGDLDWVACQGDPSACGGDDIVLSGGTSEAGPIVAAVSALVIQAYRSTHHGQDPSVSLVRDIITSSASDLGMPGSDQGAGLVNAYRAVRDAMAASGGAAAGGAGPELVADTQQLAATGLPSTTAGMSFRLTNEGNTTASVALAGRTLGPATVVLTKTITRRDSSTDQIFHFTVPHSASVLTADIAYPGGPVSNPVAISLVNPAGQLTAYSLPQGTGNHGQVEVRHPRAGTWEADISSFGPYSGPVYIQVTTADNQGFGTVTPSHVTLAPGASTNVRLSAALPAAPGDESAAVTFTAPGWGASSIPVTLRSLVPIVDGTGHFATTLIGGNGRGYVPAQTFFYSFNVPAGEPALDVQTRLAGSNNDPFFTYLIAPDGNAVAQASNQAVVGESDGAPVIVGEPGARLHTLNPPAGRWSVIITFTNPVNGNALQTPLTGTVSFAPFTVKVHALPDSASTVLAAGVQHVVAVTVHNNGDSTESFFLDGRLRRTTSLALTPITPATDLQLPLSDLVYPPLWIVPTDTTAVTASAVSTAPTTFDVSPWNGEPDVGATVQGDDASATITAPPGGYLSQGLWDVTPQQIGPFGAAGAATSTTSVSLTATTLAFDPGFESTTGDLWQQGAAAVNPFAPVVVEPGGTITIYAVITPVASPGHVVHGVLYVDDSSALTNNGSSPSGDQLAAIDYTYTVG